MSFQTIPPASYLAEPVRRYLHRYLELSREVLLRNAVRRANNFRGGMDKGNGPWHARLEGLEISPRSAYRPSLSEEDIRIHAWLNERLAALRHERRGRWSKIRRFLFGNR